MRRISYGFRKKIVTLDSHPVILFWECSRCVQRVPRVKCYSLLAGGSPRSIWSTQEVLVQLLAWSEPDPEPDHINALERSSVDRREGLLLHLHCISLEFDQARSALSLKSTSRGDQMDLGEPPVNEEWHFTIGTR